MPAPDQALSDAFTAAQPADEQVLFYLPVTRKLGCGRLVLGLVLIGHSPLRGVGRVELLPRDLFDYPISLGTVFNIVHAAVTPARQYNHAQDLRHTMSACRGP